MLENIKVKVLLKQFDHYGKVADRYIAKMKKCERGSKEFIYWFEKSNRALDKRIRILNTLYGRRTS